MIYSAAWCRSHDRYPPRAASFRVSALATFRASAPALVDANARDRFRPSASVGGRRASGDRQVRGRSRVASCFRLSAGTRGALRPRDRSTPAAPTLSTAPHVIAMTAERQRADRARAPLLLVHLTSLEVNQQRVCFVGLRSSAAIGRGRSDRRVALEGGAVVSRGARRSMYDDRARHERVDQALEVIRAWGGEVDLFGLREATRRFVDQ